MILRSSGSNNFMRSRMAAFGNSSKKSVRSSGGNSFKIFAVFLAGSSLMISFCWLMSNNLKTLTARCTVIVSTIKPSFSGNSFTSSTTSLMFCSSKNSFKSGMSSLERISKKTSDNMISSSNSADMAAIYEIILGYANFMQ